MTDCAYPIYSNLWFWMITIGILFLAIGLIIWDVRAQLSESWWVWVLIIAGLILLTIGIFLAVWQWWRQDSLDTELYDVEPMTSCPNPKRAVKQTTTIREMGSPRREIKQSVVQREIQTGNDL